MSNLSEEQVEEHFKNVMERIEIKRIKFRKSIQMCLKTKPSGQEMIEYLKPIYDKLVFDFKPKYINPNILVDALHYELEGTFLEFVDMRKNNPIFNLTYFLERINKI